jgi:tetratricopeptide repeat protein
VTFSQRLNEWPVKTREISRKGVYWLSFVLAVLVGMALVDLAIRAAVRLDLTWDTFEYHLPFAAIRGGLGIPYEPTDFRWRFFQGFPPLPHLVQGLLWRLTGSVNATGTVNYLALCLFLAYGHLVLRAPFWMVGAVALTAPLVSIHAATSYNDLFSNAFLAIGVASLAALYLSERYAATRIWFGGLAGLTAAAWSKYQMVPFVAVFLGAYGLLLWHPRVRRLATRASLRLAVVAALVLSATPYAINLQLYGNPFWPVRIPVVGDHFPYAYDERAYGPTQRPVLLRNRSQAELFVHSLLEINHPTSYPGRPRWTADQGTAAIGLRMGGFWNIAFRMGGFWNIAVVSFLGLLALFLWLHGGRKAWVLGAGAVGTLVMTAVQPESHWLRFYLFLPLSWAALLGMLLPGIRARYPAVAAGALALVTVLFVSSSWLNEVHYRIERIGYREAARYWGAEPWWPRLQSGVTYCARNMYPIGILLTGPTMKEFRIVDRRDAETCPAGSVEVRNVRTPEETHASLEAAMMQAGLDALYARNDVEAAAAHFRKVLAQNPSHYGATFQLALTLDRAGRAEEARPLWERVLRLAETFGDKNTAAMARARLGPR